LRGFGGGLMPRSIGGYVACAGRACAIGSPFGVRATGLIRGATAGVRSGGAVPILRRSFFFVTFFSSRRRSRSCVHSGRHRAMIAERGDRRMRARLAKEE
jgi:hypothetical protein